MLGWAGHGDRRLRLHGVRLPGRPRSRRREAAAKAPPCLHAGGSSDEALKAAAAKADRPPDSRSLAFARERSPVCPGTTLRELGLRHSLAH